MLPTLEGTVARRVLLNFRADPTVVRRLVAEPLEVETVKGYAVVGVCLMRLVQLRVKGMPPGMGFASENMAHWVAVRFPAGSGSEDGVFIWRRETDSGLLAQLGGKLFPAEFNRAQFAVKEDSFGLSIEVSTEHSRADVSLLARHTQGWGGSELFPAFPEVSHFFRRGECAFTCAGRDGALEGVRLHALRWEMAPLEVSTARAYFFEQPEYFSPGSVAFDSAVVMRGIPHEWHLIDRVPELAGAM